MKTEYPILLPLSIGGISLGMSQEEVWDLLGVPEESDDAHEKWGIQFQAKDHYLGSSIQIRYDEEMKIEDIQFSSHPSYVVTFDSVPLHESKIEKISEAISLKCPVDENWKEYPSSHTFPEIGISLWRESSDKHYFDTVNLTKPWKRSEQVASGNEGSAPVA